MPDEQPLVPADPDDVQRTLESALTYYSGHPRRRARFTEADGLKVTITAGHLAKELARAGLVVMRKAPSRPPVTLPTHGVKPADADGGNGT